MPCRAWEAHRSWWTCSAPAKIAQPPKTHSALKYKAKRGFLQATPSVNCCLHAHPRQQDATRHKRPEEATGQTHYPRTYLVTNSGRQRLAAISAAAAASLLCAGCVHSTLQAPGAGPDSGAIWTAAALAHPVSIQNRLCRTPYTLILDGGLLTCIPGSIRTPQH